MKNIYSTLGSITLAAAFVLMPLAANASTLNATGTTVISTSPNGIVRIIGADVTAVGDGFINIATTIGGTVLNWLVNITANTKVFGSGTANASTTGIAIGDRVSLKGTLTSTSTSPFVVSATKVRDGTNFWMGITGKHFRDRDEATSTDSDNDGHKEHRVNANAQIHANANANFKDGHEGNGHGIRLFNSIHLGLGEDD